MNYFCSSPRICRAVALTWLILLLAVMLTGCMSTGEWKEKGQKDYQNGKYSDAISAYDRAIAITPNDSELYYIKGLSLYEMVRYKDAIDAFTDAIRQNGNYSLA